MKIFFIWNYKIELLSFIFIAELLFNHQIDNHEKCYVMINFFFFFRKYSKETYDYVISTIKENPDSSVMGFTTCHGFIVSSKKHFEVWDSFITNDFQMNWWCTFMLPIINENLIINLNMMICCLFKIKFT